MARGSSTRSARATSCGRSAPPPARRRDSRRMGVSPEVDPEEWPNARYRPVWGWNPMSTAPHLWRLLLDARAPGARLVVVDPFRSRTARVADAHLRPLPGTDAALALGMMRAIVDAGLHDEACAARTPTAWTSCGARWTSTRSSAAPRCAASPAESIAAVGARVRGHAPGAAAARRRRAAPQRRAAGLPHARVPAGARRAPGGPRRRLLVHPDGDGRGHRLRASSPGPDLRPGPVRDGSTCRSSGAALTDPALDPPITALVVWNSNPAVDRTGPGRVLAGLRREDLFTVVLEQFLTDTARHADVVLPSTTAARAPRRRVLVGPSLRHLQRARDRAARARRSRTPRSSACWPPAWASTTPAFRESDEELVGGLLASGRPA